MRRVMIALCCLWLLAAGCQRQPASESARPPAAPTDLATRFRAAVERQAPELGVSVVDPDTLSLKTPAGVEAQISLDNLKQTCQSDPAECQAALEHFAQVAVETAREAGKRVKPDRKRIRAVLKNEQFIETLKKVAAQGPEDKAKDNQVVYRKFLDDLWVVYVLDQPGSMALIDRGTMRELGLSEPELYELALANMERDLPDVAGKPLSLPGVEGLYGIEAGDSYEAARLLLASRWKKIAAGFDGHLVACAPIRDVVLYADGRNTKALMAMRVIARRMMREEPYTLSRDLLRYTPEGWKPLRPGTAP